MTSLVSFLVRMGRGLGDETSNAAIRAPQGERPGIRHPRLAAATAAYPSPPPVVPLQRRPIMSCHVAPLAVPPEMAGAGASIAAAVAHLAPPAVPPSVAGAHASVAAAVAHLASPAVPPGVAGAHASVAAAVAHLAPPAVPPGVARAHASIDAAPEAGPLFRAAWRGRYRASERIQAGRRAVTEAPNPPAAAGIIPR